MVGILQDHCISFPAQEDIGDWINLWFSVDELEKKGRNPISFLIWAYDQEDFLESQANYQRLEI